MNWTVYGLIDPRDANVFYIGLTIDPKQRFESHMNDKQSAAWKWCQAIKESGQRPSMCVFGETDVYAEALHLERALITAIPHTHNRTLINKRREFWMPFELAELARDEAQHLVQAEG